MFRLFTLFLLCCVSGFSAASQGITIAQLTTFMRSSIQQKQPDREVAQYVVHLKLSEKLEAATIEQLQSEGLGPKTVAALKGLMTESATLPAPVPVQEAPKPVALPDPPYEEQQQVISDMTEYALNYTKRLPDFLCTQVTHRYVDPRFRGSWITMDTIVTKVSYNEGHENYEVKLVNNSLVENKTMESLNGAISTGEFGTVMRQIFEPETGAEFHFDHWGTLRKQRVYVFNYAIEQDRSKYSIEYDRKQRIVTAYKGKIYVEKASHKITRITSEAVDIPPSFPVRATSEIIDYGLTTIGTQDYMLPMRAEVLISDSEVATKGVIDFRSYNKFGADVKLNYDLPDEPVDDSKNKETPAKPESPK